MFFFLHDEKQKKTELLFVELDKYYLRNLRYTFISKPHNNIARVCLLKKKSL